MPRKDQKGTAQERVPETKILTSKDIEREHSRTSWEDIEADGKKYKVNVLRGVPTHTAIFLQTSPEALAVRGKSDVKFADLSVEDQKIFTNWNRLVVAVMIVDPLFSFNGEVYHDSEEKAYPVENISANMLNALFGAYQRVNIPNAAPRDEVSTEDEARDNVDEQVDPSKSSTQVDS